MKNLILLSITLLAISCQKNNNSLQIPELIERSEKLQYSNEWPEVKNTYADLKHIIKNKKNNIDEYIQLSNLFIAEARVTGEHGHYYNAALKLLERVLNEKKITKDQKFLALSNKSSVQLSLHEFDKALSTAEEAVQLNPYNAKIYGALIDANVELGNYDKAVEYSDKMISIRPDIRSYSRVSYLREIHGMTNESIDAMKMAVEAGSPGSEERAWAALQLAELLLRYNKVREAEQTLNQLLSERENYPFALGALAEVYLLQNNLEKAETTLKEACKIIPEVGFFITLAKIYKLQNRTDEMNLKLNEVLDMLKDDTEHGHNMSLEYASLYLEFFNDPDKAIEYLKEDQKMRPDNIDINRLLTKIYLIKNDKAKALQCMVKAKKTNSLHPELKELEEQLQNI